MKKELEKCGILEENASLKDLNTYRIDTKTRYLLHPRTVEELKKFLKLVAEKSIPYFVLGNGSNVILSDTTYPGVVVKLDQFKKIVYHDDEVVVGAGVMLNFLSKDVIFHGLSGLEWASGIPGTVGGSIFNNAEAYKVSTFDLVKDVTVITPKLEIKTILKEDLEYGYRTSYFKKHPEILIVGATLKLKKGNKEESLKLIRERFLRRFFSQPLDYPSAGSVFKNPSSSVASWQLISELGLKGKRINDAMISVKHANFIINLGNATGKDIRSLIQLVHDEVERVYHIDLILEQEFKDW